VFVGTLTEALRNTGSQSPSILVSKRKEIKVWGRNMSEKENRWRNMMNKRRKRRKFRRKMRTENRGRIRDILRGRGG